MSSRPGVMNAQQAKALREAGPGADRRHAPGSRRARPRRPLHDAATAAADTRQARGAIGLADVLAGRPARRTINEFDAKRLLAAYGVPVTREHRVATLAEAHARRPRARLSGRAQGAVGRDSAQDRARSRRRRPQDRGGPRARLRAPARAARPDRSAAADAAFLVQEFVAGGVEVFAGISRDPDFGLSLAFGMGGTAIEVTRDFALRMLPLREGDAEAMIAETRGAAMLGAVRGRPAADVEEPRRLPQCARRFRLRTMPICSPRSISIRSRRCRRAAAASWSMP